MNDLISRQAAIDAVHAEFDECLVWDESGERTANEVEDILYRVPSAEPFFIKIDRLVKADERERLEKELCRKMTRQNLILLEPGMELVYPKRKGKWVRNIHDKIICNQCGMFGNNEWNFCPNCGADMRDDG